ncbi:MAG TPA: universal stress protein [Dehalococcoidia bacterium]|nr:universal stress protein [Dehalococcoidia bacterium]
MQMLTALDLRQPHEATVALAVRAAQRLQADVHLLTVISPHHEHGTFVPAVPFGGAASRPAADPSGGLIPYPTPPSAADVIVETRTQAAVRAVDEAHDRLANLGKRFSGRPVTLAVEIHERPAAAIAAYARRQPIDLVVMGTHARGAVRRTVLGSVAEGVVRELEIPVLLAGPHMQIDHTTGWTTLIVCVDGSPFAESILPLAAWVRRLDLRVVLVSVAPVDPVAVPPADVLEGNYVHGLAEALRRQGVDAQWDVLHGDDAARAISDYAASWPGSVIALATHARHGLPRLFSGSVAMRVVQQARGPVLVLHPRTLLGEHR